MFDIRCMLEQMSPDEVLKQVQEEITKVQREKALDEDLQDARDAVISAFAAYMYELSGHQMSDRDMAKLEKAIIKICVP